LEESVGESMSSDDEGDEEVKEVDMMMNWWIDWWIDGDGSREERGDDRDGRPEILFIIYSSQRR
jgi:hypothetical protein